MTRKKINVRRAAVGSLIAFSKQGKYTNLEVASFLSKSDLSDADKRLYTNLVYGTAERIPTLDHIITRLSSRPIETTDIETLTCLRLGLYQLLYTDKIPDHAAVSETVDASPARSKGYVNAVLRQFIRNGKKYDLPPEDNTALYMSVRYSCPVGMCEFLISKLGADIASKIACESVSERPVTLRVNTIVTDAETLLKNKFPDCEVNPLFGDMIDVRSLGGTDMESPEFFVQDAASRLAVAALSPEAGEFIIDVCAAPGGKTFSAAIDMKDQGRVLSFDLHANKISLIKSGAAKLGLSIVEAYARDAGDPDPSLARSADRVICDAPCSGLGVMAKKPDIKYKDVSEFERLPAVQLRVLSGAATYLKPGGVMVYSTCTLNPDENEGVVKAFLDEDDDFELVPFTAGGIASEKGMLTLFPFEHGTDGFFIAKLMRKQ
ncbi:MAG: 16S rRNA (cytosine(967)-C(5))-methyltransferase RsmB [Clostridia bacterium]|nr:16S rRNA (cytosine(967)-C(5))-methyltransferase RsmB [Clostridia bacterium]